MPVFPFPFTVTVESSGTVGGIEEVLPLIKHLHVLFPTPVLGPPALELLSLVRARRIPLSVTLPLPWDSPRELIGHLKECGALAKVSVTWPIPEGEGVEQLRLAWGSGLPLWLELGEGADLPADLPAAIGRAGDPRLRGVSLRRHAFKDLLPALKEAQEALPDNEIPIVSQSCLELDSPFLHGELAGFTGCFVDASGEVRPCAHSPVSFGNLARQTLRECWSGKNARAWRGRHPLSGAVPPPSEAALPRVLLSGALTPTPRFSFLPHENGGGNGEETGGLLVGGSGRILPLSQRGARLVGKLDGTRSLREIRQRFGAGGLSFTYFLHHHGLVTFRRGSS